LIGTQANVPAVVEAMKKSLYPLKLPNSIKAAAAELAREGYNLMRWGATRGHCDVRAPHRGVGESKGIPILTCEVLPRLAAAPPTA
jgi:hypothetical protein